MIQNCFTLLDYNSSLMFKLSTACMKNLLVLTLCNASSFTVQFSYSVSKTMAILLFMIKIIEMFELHASM